MLRGIHQVFSTVFTLKKRRGRAVYNQCPSRQEITGSSPVPPIFAPILSGEPGLRELLEVLLGPEGRRRLELRDKTNDELFTLYDADLVLRVMQRCLKKS